MPSVGNGISSIVDKHRHQEILKQMEEWLDGASLLEVPIVECELEIYSLNQSHPEVAGLKSKAIQRKGLILTNPCLKKWIKE